MCTCNTNISTHVYIQFQPIQHMCTYNTTYPTHVYIQYQHIHTYLYIQFLSIHTFIHTRPTYRRPGERAEKWYPSWWPRRGSLRRRRRTSPDVPGLRPYAAGSWCVGAWTPGAPGTARPRNPSERLEDLRISGAQPRDWSTGLPEYFHLFSERKRERQTGGID